MQPPERLDGLYARHELYAEKAAARKGRAELRALAGQGQGSAIPLQESIPETDATEETDESQRVQDVFARLLRPKEGTDASAAE
jgi:hypothetical protein